MNISSIIVHAKPDALSSVRGSLEQIPVSRLDSGAHEQGFGLFQATAQRPTLGIRRFQVRLCCAAISARRLHLRDGRRLRRRPRVRLARFGLCPRD